MLDIVHKPCYYTRKWEIPESENAMSDKIRIVVDEDTEIVGRIDAIADAEGTSRAAIIRRAIRRMLLSLPTVPTCGYIPQDDEQVTA